MKKFLFTMMAALVVPAAFSQVEDGDSTGYEGPNFTYEYGTVMLKGGIAKVVVPPGFKYLNAEQAEEVLVEYWGNPQTEDMTLGFILPEEQEAEDYEGYVFNIEYDDLGYVEDKDAGNMDYDDLLKEMQQDTEDANQERIAEGYQPVILVGWAAKPFYDKEKKVLHWAKELRFGEESEDGENTLNYNIRILGRKGILILNAIAPISDLPHVEGDIDKVLGAVEFTEGNKYADFNPSIDKVAQWTIGGLIAGKILAKAGFLAIILKFWKIIALAAAGASGFLFKKKKKKPEAAGEETPEETGEKGE
jgi:uncharacterized membrane-anchored protein